MNFRTPDDSLDFYPLAVLRGGSQAFERNTAWRRQLGSTEKPNVRPYDLRSEIRKRSEPVYFDELSGLKTELHSRRIHPDTCGRVLN
ncbi:MAG: hypothetical protein ACREB3_10310, partial [Burkholderiales bacterium]